MDWQDRQISSGAGEGRVSNPSVLCLAVRQFSYNCAREDSSRLLSSAASSGCAASATPHQTQCISGEVGQGSKRCSDVASAIRPSSPAVCFLPSGKSKGYSSKNSRMPSWTWTRLDLWLEGELSLFPTRPNGR